MLPNSVIIPADNLPEHLTESIIQNVRRSQFAILKVREMHVEESICNIESQGNACGLFGKNQDKTDNRENQIAYAIREFAIMRWEHHMLMVYL